MIRGSLESLAASSEKAGAAQEAMLISRYILKKAQEQSPEVRAAFTILRADLALGKHHS